RLQDTEHIGLRTIHGEIPRRKQHVIQDRRSRPRTAENKYRSLGSNAEAHVILGRRIFHGGFHNEPFSRAKTPATPEPVRDKPAATVLSPYSTDKGATHPGHSYSDDA